MGLHEKDTLQLTHLQKQRYHIDKIADIFPKYYLLNVNNFNDMAHDTLDEWVSFFKNSGVKDNFRAGSLDKTKEKLRYKNLYDEEKKMYDRSIENRRIEMSVEYTREVEAKQQKAIAIAKHTGLTLENIQRLRNNQ